MYARVFAFFGVLICLVGCAKQRYQEYIPYTDDGVQKPRVALASVKESSGVRLPWSTSEEITHGVRYFLRCDGDLYLLSQDEVDATNRALGDRDPFGTDLSPWANFCNADYVVAIDLFERKEVPFERGQFYPLYPTSGHHSNTVLAMKVRLKVIDIRGARPKIVLCEILDSNHLLPRDHDSVDYTEAYWGTDGYSCTPYGMVHNRLIHQISERLKMIMVHA